MTDKKIQITARCPIRTTMELLGGKWKLLIIQQLRTGDKRSHELKELLPDISEKMLFQELKSLLESGLISKKTESKKPPKVVYSITIIGEKTYPLLKSMRDFALEYEAFIDHNI
ncbi:transcriptional regulator, HxlR family [Marivirga sericea]|uniref:Transcriptional regulator, HxlR family n=1 Tax=Marivirga sericea TaxID=1028 RepID=A0A1X7K5N8_9BACT|nr:helix-turn-helix domain-containing protein [Marivirga sericea]SMG35631.1 transcriptional regulator, HxlR family [Marivirga sericea]